MKCRKCGADMLPDHLYCDICGAEYQVVPDFEPELEYSLAQSMGDIRESMGKDKQDNKEKTERKGRKNKESFTIPSFFPIFMIVLLLSVFAILGYFQYSTSVQYRTQQAAAAIGEQDYYKAAQIYEAIRKENPQDAYWYVKEAEARWNLGQEEKAFLLAYSSVELEENQELAYDFLLSCLKESQEYIKMSQYLKQCPFAKIQEKYADYMCEIPTVNYAGGRYETSLELRFEITKGNLYYTLDNSIPDRQSPVWDKPLELGNGTHVLYVRYENSFGVLSEAVRLVYEIHSDIPLPPAVLPDSGNYTQGTWIELELEEGTRVYYTTDLSLPTENSKEYTGPIPMPLGESVFHFVAFSEKGIEGGMTQRNYFLNLKANFSTREAEKLLVEKLILTGHLLDSNGAVQDRYGVFRYFYKFPMSVGDQNFYVFEEHYLENQINNPLKHYYAVEVLTGSVYPLNTDKMGRFVLGSFS